MPGKSTPTKQTTIKRLIAFLLFLVAVACLVGAFAIAGINGISESGEALDGQFYLWFIGPLVWLLYLCYLAIDSLRAKR